ncbi:MAG: YdbL family protein [Desulfonatronovibrio sp.]
MRKINIAVVILAVFGLMVLFSTQAYARTKEQVTSSMRDRYPALQEAKDAGYIGEAWTGLVALVDPDAPASARSLVKAENKDRVDLFQIVAGETDTSVEEVARQNRIRMYRLADDDHFIQDQERQWVRKKELSL